jgi:hypothetical protein
MQLRSYHELSSGDKAVLRPDGDDVVRHQGVGPHLSNSAVRRAGRLSSGQKRAQHIQLGDDSHQLAVVVYHRKGIEVVAVEPRQQIEDRRRR